MNKIEDKILEFFRICIYSFAVFGVAMFISYIFVLVSPDRSYIPMMGIKQTVCYIGGATIAILLCLSDIFLEKIPIKIRIVLFFALLYIMGIIYFKYIAFEGVLTAKQYILFSLWIIYMSLLVLMSWGVYSFLINNKYDKCLKAYKNKFNNSRI